MLDRYRYQYGMIFVEHLSVKCSIQNILIGFLKILAQF